MKFSPSSFESYQVGKVGRGSAHELSVTPNGLHPLIAAIVKGLPRIWLQVVPAAREFLNHSSRIQRTSNLS